MKYYSLNKVSPPVSFRQATITGQAPDKGLYFPEWIPKMDTGFIKNIHRYSNEEIALNVLKPFIGDEIEITRLEEIVAETVNFEIPLIPITASISTLELFHGNTLAFKDIGARFMSRCLGYFVKDFSKKITVLVATSGDTGGAVADGFFNIEGIEVIILYPSGKVSLVQEKQLTTYGGNVHAIEVNGSFDDCQKLVKQAFTDEQLNKKFILTSANSINVARWLPQQVFYYFAYKQWEDKLNPPVISVPSGNFGNICAGLLASLSGLPIKHFVAACNTNNVVTRYLDSQLYEPKKSIATISNAMDVGEPSNFVRILELFNQQYHGLKNVMSSYSISDDETREAIRTVFEENKYILDPHGAVGYAALKKYLAEHPSQTGLFLETAHPVKFYNVVEPLLNIKVPVPEKILDIMVKPKDALFLNSEYDSFKELLLDR